MNRISALVVAAAFTLVPALAILAQAPAAAKEKPFGNTVLEQALANMSRLKGYHVSAELTTPIGKAKLVGDLGVGALSIKGEDPRGNTRLRVVVDENFYLSADEGKTWKSGAEAERDKTILFSKLLTGPVDHGMKFWEKGEFKAIEEKVDGEDLLHLEKAANGKEPATHFWLVREPEMENAIFVRKASMTIAADDGDFPITVTYTKLNKPAEIKAPITK
jgi:hypothetical protein